ncbi:uncharacterized protein METZ01_LOCUS238643 [marine metagenome]|uniref:Transmembrane protein (PGPGW) n=1 Tax=marine metagenome TaxID=408172 RepID=A0A382HF44_9ZZZZ
MAQNYHSYIWRWVRDYPRWFRISVGICLVLGGILGFLPILGFWMIPLGLVVLSYDLPIVRRWRRRLEVRWLRWWRGRISRSSGS